MSSPSFRFRLERVRDLRARREDLAKQALASAMARQEQARQELRAAEDRVAQAREAQLGGSDSPRTASDLVALQAYLERTELASAATAANLERHQRELASKREILTAAARDRQALERLKERRRAEFEREAARVEGLSLDEIALNNFRRRAA